jgi:hypothetical protein
VHADSPDQEQTKLAERQYVVVWSILGPVLLLAALTTLGLFFSLLAGHRTESALSVIAGILYLFSGYGMLIATPFLLYFGSTGLIEFSRTRVKRKRLTIALCIGALSLPFLAFGALVFMNSRLAATMS